MEPLRPYDHLRRSDQSLAAECDVVRQLVKPIARCRGSLKNAILVFAATSIFMVPPMVRGQGAATAPEGTFSLIAHDPATGELGMGVQSKALAAGSRTMTIKGGVAAIAHQSQSNPMYGSLGLELLATGMTPQQALELMLRGDKGRETRQVAIIDATGRTAAWTGSAALAWKGHQCGRDYCAQGNILTGPEVVQAIVKAFEGSHGLLADRILSALDAGQAAGGDARGTQAAALVVAKPLGGAAGFGDRVVDLRVDDHRAPLVELRRLLNLFRSRHLVAEANARLEEKNTAVAAQAAAAARDMSPENDEAWVAFAATELSASRRASALDA